MINLQTIKTILRQLKHIALFRFLFMFLDKNLRLFLKNARIQKFLKNTKNCFIPPPSEKNQTPEIINILLIGYNCY